MITVFTPTYNRGNLINNLYESRLRQTNHDFEWLIVDDGSTDNTSQYFDKILSIDNPFLIRYFKTENGGKHRAINKALDLANGNLFFIVDSDDYLTDDAIEKIYGWVATLDDSKKWAGVSGLRDIKGRTLPKVNYEYIDLKNNERYKHNMEFDHAEVYFTDVLRKYKFPEIPGENFISEEVVWNAIAIDGYYLRWFNSVIYMCEYLDDGLTKNAREKFVKNPGGVRRWAQINLKAYRNLRKRMQAVWGYYRILKKEDRSVAKVAKDLNIGYIFALLCISAGKLLRKN